MVSASAPLAAGRGRRPVAVAGMVACVLALAVGAALMALGGRGPLVLVGVVAFATLFLAPIWVFAPLVLVATVVSDVARLQLGDSATLFGQGEMVLGISSVVAFRMILAEGRLPLPRRVVVVLALYVASLLFTAVVASVYGRLEFAELQRSLSYLLAFGVGIAVASEPAHRLPAVRAIAVVTVVSGVGGLLYWGWVNQVVTPPAGLATFFAQVMETSRLEFLDPTRSRVPWVDHHPNRVAVLFALLLAFVLPPLLATRRRGDLVLALLAVTGATGGVLATQSRTGLVVLLVLASAAALLVQLRQRGETRALTLIGLAVLLPLMVFVHGLLPQERAFSLEDGNFQSRQFIWSDALGVFGESPFWGHGLDYAAGPHFWGDLSAHNEYLAQLVDGGVIGGLVFALLLAAFVQIAWRVFHRGGPDGALGLGALTFFAVLLVSMFVATTWRTAASVIVSWLFLGMLTATYAVPAARAPEDDAAATESR